MKEKKNIVAIVLATVCLMSMLFAWRAFGAGIWPYEPWWDLNDDGKIDIQDLARESGAFATAGNPAKNVNVTNFPLDAQGNIRVNSTGSSQNSVLEAKSQVSTIVGPGSYDIRPPPGEIWIMYYVSMNYAGGTGVNILYIYLVDSTTGKTIPLRSGGGNVFIAYEIEGVCSYDVYYRVQVLFGGSVTWTYAYNAVRVK